MASPTYYQAPSAPPMYPEVGGRGPPEPPVREEFAHQQHYQEQALLPSRAPKPPKRMDKPSGASPTNTITRRDDQEDGTGDANVDVTCKYNHYAPMRTIALALLQLVVLLTNVVQVRTLVLQKQHDTIWIVTLILVCLSIVCQFGLGFILYLLLKGARRSSAKQGKQKCLDIALLITVGVFVGINLTINVFMLTTNPQSFLDTRSLELLQQAQSPS